MQPDESNPLLRFRKLRIAWSVAWGVACVLLICLWVRSYSQKYTLVIPRQGTTIYVTSQRGEIDCLQTAFHDEFGDMADFGWQVMSESLATDEKQAVRAFSYFHGVWQNEFGFAFPQWCPVLIATVVAAVPWVPYSPRRFSLRTLLIATTLVAVVLGLAVYAAST